MYADCLYNIGKLFLYRQIEKIIWEIKICLDV